MPRRRAVRHARPRVAEGGRAPDGDGGSVADLLGDRGDGLVDVVRQVEEFQVGGGGLALVHDGAAHPVDQTALTRRVTPDHTPTVIETKFGASEVVSDIEASKQAAITAHQLTAMTAQLQQDATHQSLADNLKL